MTIKEILEKTVADNGILGKLIFCDKNVITDKIKVIMINETAPEKAEYYFYSDDKDADYMKTSKMLFAKAGIDINDPDDLLQMGIYLTVAVKSCKTQYSVETISIKKHLPLLEEELNLFKNLKVIMLMGDVAKKAFNMIAKKNTGKIAVPSGSTYKIRKDKFYYQNIRVMPSYIMTGGNILIEKSKQQMVAEDIKEMLTLI